MRITIVTGFFLPVPPVRGGSTEKIWFRLAREFATAGHTVTFVSRRWPGLPDRETIDGVSHLRVRGAAHSRRLSVNLWRDAVWGRRVARILPTADVVICNTLTLPIWLRRARPAAGRVAVVVARMPRGQTRLYGGVDFVLSLSEAVSERVRKENPRLASRIVDFPYPIDCDLHQRTGSRRGSPLKIGYVGRVHPEKGLALLLAAASGLTREENLPPWQLEIAGPDAVADGGAGPHFREALLQQFGDVLGSRLTWSGPEFDATKLAQRYAGLDVFCYPSLAESGETFGVAVAEAMASGCAPVVSDLPCFRSLVRDGETGLVFDPHAADAAEALATTLARLLRDNALRERLARAAQTHARAFDVAPRARALLATLTERLAQGSMHAAAGEPVKR